MRQYPLHRFTGEGRARFVTIIAPNRLMSEDASSKNSSIKQRKESPQHTNMSGSVAVIMVVGPRFIEGPALAAALALNTPG